MSGARIPIVTSEMMYKCDQAMTQEYGIPSSVLMENAASAVFHVLHKEFPALHKEKVLVITGPGKNGQDGLVLTRQLYVADVDVSTVILPPSGCFSSEYQEKVNQLSALGITIMNILPQLNSYTIIIDAIFGIGLSRPPEGVYREAIEKINSSSAKILSLDIPSGINSHGRALGVAVLCDYCISFGMIKLGNMLNDGYAHCASLYLANLHAPYSQYLLSSEPNLLLNTPITLPVRNKCGYKKSFGSCLVVGGSNNYHGAPVFAASAFMKTGGGYVHLVSTDNVALSAGSSLPECVLHPFHATNCGSLPSLAFDTIEMIGEEQDFIIAGPGLGISDDTKLILNFILQSERLSNIPLLIDGDGLSILAENLKLISYRPPYTTILTPHLGEMARLTGYSVKDIENNLISIAQEFSHQWQVLLLVKGPRSVIATNNTTYINTTGTEALSTAGSGDILDGIIGALCASPLGMIDGLRNGVFIHGLIGNKLSDSGDSRSSMATDIINTIPLALRDFTYLADPLKEKQIPRDVLGICFID